MDDAELLKDLIGLDKPQLFDENDTDMSFLPCIWRRFDPFTSHEWRGRDESRRVSHQHIEIPQFQYTDKVADDSIVIQRQISPRTTETKAPEHQQDDRSGGDADFRDHSRIKFSQHDGYQA